jgi:hypothetical protein
LSILWKAFSVPGSSKYNNNIKLRIMQKRM